MRIDKNFQFSLNISTEGYESKREAISCLTTKGAKSVGKNRMAFKESKVTPSEFIELATTGHSFCHLFKFDENKKYYINSGHWKTLAYPVYKRGANKGAMKIAFKCNNFFRGAQCVFVDIDYTWFESIFQYQWMLTYKPTCTYCSYSDKLEKGGVTSRRFRMVYVFDTEMDECTFKYVSTALYEAIAKDTNEAIVDDCGSRVSQYMNGVYGNDEVYVTDTIYSVEDFTKDIENIKARQEEGEECGCSVESDVKIDEKVANDLKKLPYETFVRKYAGQYTTFYQTVYDFNGEAYHFTDENFIKLFWNKEKLADGQKRRKKLFDRACLRRLMKPNTTPEEVLYNLNIDVYRFFDNSDKVITPELLIAKVRRAFSYNIEDIRNRYSNTTDYYTVNRPTFVVNDDINNKRQAIGAIRHRISIEKVGEVYDTTKSVAENLELLNEMGVKIKKSALYVFCKENGINTKPAKEEGLKYDHNKSVRENAKTLGITYYKALQLSKKCIKENDIQD